MVQWGEIVRDMQGKEWLTWSWVFESLYLCEEEEDDDDEFILHDSSDEEEEELEEIDMSGL